MGHQLVEGLTPTALAILGGVAAIQEFAARAGAWGNTRIQDLKVAIRDAEATEQSIQTLMGRDVAPRFEFIMERAPKVDEVDV